MVAVLQDTWWRVRGANNPPKCAPDEMMIRKESGLTGRANEKIDILYMAAPEPSLWVRGMFLGAFPPPMVSHCSPWL